MRMSRSMMKSYDRAMYRPTSSSARSQRLRSFISWKIRCHDSLSAAITMPRKIRRLVGVLKIVGTQHAIEQSVGARMIDQNQLARAAGALGAEMRLEPALPVRVAKPRRARGDGELRRHEVVVRHGIGGEMREVAEPERAKRIVPRAVEDLHPDVPRMTMPSRGRVLLRDARVRGDRAVQEVVREFLQERGDAGRQKRERPHDRLAEKDVGSGRPGVRDVRGDRDGDHRDDEPSRDTPRVTTQPRAARRECVRSQDASAAGARRGAGRRARTRRRRRSLHARVPCSRRILAILAEMLADLVARNALPRGLASIGGPARADAAEPRRMTAGPARAASNAFDQRHHRPSPGRSAPEQIRQSRADRRSDQRGGEEIVFVLMPAVGFRGADGHAGLLGAPAAADWGLLSWPSPSS